MEVYAGFSEYTDAQVGRIIDYLEQSGQLENTLVLYAADNGASGEGSPNGSVNENKFFNGYPDELVREHEAHRQAGRTGHLRTLSDRMGRRHFAPFKMFKRYSEYAGGTCDPLVISWPKGIKAKRRGPQPVSPLHRHRPDHPGGLRAGDAQGVQGRGAVPALRRLDALQLRREAGRADAEEAPVLRHARHPRDVGGRLEGRRHARAALRQGPLRQGRVGAVPRGRGPRRIEEPGQGASREAPGADQGLVRGGGEEPRAAARRPHARWSSSPSSGPPRKRPARRYIYYPGHVLRCRKASPSTCAAVRTRSSPTSRSPIRLLRACIFAHGSRFGGHSLFIKDKKLYYVYNFLGIPPEQKFVSPELKPGKYTLGMEFTRESAGKFKESVGKTKLYVNDKVVAEGPMRAQVGKFTLCGDGLCVGFDSADAVSQEYCRLQSVQGRDDPVRRRHRREGAVPRPGDAGRGGVRRRLDRVSSSAQDRQPRRGAAVVSRFLDHRHSRTAPTHRGARRSMR